jgi:hypothetical protein
LLKQNVRLKQNITLKKHVDDRLVIIDACRCFGCNVEVGELIAALVDLTK